MQVDDRTAHVSMIVRDPHWLAHRYDPGHDSLHFLRVSADILQKVPFLTDAELPANLTSVVLGREESMATVPAAAPMHFIFHSAYCCSTLLARAFDRPGLATVLREPVLLNDWIGWRRKGARPDHVQAVGCDLLALLARPSTTGETVIVKPSNVLNGLAPAILEQHPSINALLLHAPLPVYLASIIRKGMWGALWVREHLRGALQDGMVNLGFQRDDFLGQTDLQVAAMGWLAQHALFQGLARRYGSARIATIDSETLLARRGEALSRLARLFGLTIAETEIAEIADGPIFTRHSKFATPYDARSRAQEQIDVPADRRDELDKVLAWTDAVARSAGIAMTLPSPLLG